MQHSRARPAATGPGRDPPPRQALLRTANSSELVVAGPTGSRGAVERRRGGRERLAGGRLVEAAGGRRAGREVRSNSLLRSSNLLLSVSAGGGKEGS
jgi:hypothetical protein